MPENLNYLDLVLFEDLKYFFKNIINFIFEILTYFINLKNLFFSLILVSTTNQYFVDEASQDFNKKHITDIKSNFLFLISY